MGNASAEGGITFSGNQPPTAPNVTASFPKDPGTSNIVAHPDPLAAATDHAGDGDYDDPYPGGPTPSLGLPIDG